jgi:hypothetical protein
MASNQKKEGQLPSKRQLEKEAQRLRLNPEWNPASRKPRESREERLRQSIEGDRIASVLETADECEACAEERKLTNDPTALCEKHLRRAMGL